MSPTRLTGCLSLLLLGTSLHAQPKVSLAHAAPDAALPGFRFPHFALPAKNDAATGATFTLIEGERDPNGATLEKLHDGTLPTGQDQGAENFFFAARTDGGRLLVDLGSAQDITQVNSFSWHPKSRGPQVYKLYVADGKAPGFNLQPKRPLDPAKAGWKLLASVDTRAEAPIGGQYAVSVADSTEGAALGRFQYLLLDISQTAEGDIFSNTFWSEIDVVAKGSTVEPIEAPVLDAFEMHNGAFHFTIDTTETPDLGEWARKELAPVIQEWYVKLVDLLPSEGYSAPRTFSVTFKKDMDGVAYTAGTRVVCAANWYRRNLKGEGIGSVVHELVHVVQQYGQARRAPGAVRPPGWLVEGIPDYVRFYKYEPQIRGAAIRADRAAGAKYDGLYRPSANFLNWASETFDKDLVPRLNAALRSGTYADSFWSTLSGKPVEALAEDWKKALAEGKGAH